MSNLSNPQTLSLVLSLLGIIILLACLALIVTKRVPELKSPQTIKALGFDLNISLITLLVLVGLVLALTSTYLQVRNYDERLNQAETRATSLETALARAGKINVHAVINLDGVNNIAQLPQLPIVGKYYVRDDGWKEGKVTPGVYSLDLILTMEDISPTASVERIQITDQKSQKTWGLDHLDWSLTSPRFTLKPTD